MKRRRETEKQNSSELRSAIEELSLLAVIMNHRRHHDHDPVAVVVADNVPKKNVTHHLPLKPFISLCNFLLHLLDKIGPTMIVLRQDISRNIMRLEKMHELDPKVYSNVVEILKKEAKEGTSKKVTSCSKAFLWLTRCLDFTGNLLELIGKDCGVDMEKAVEKAYESTLKPWHGWISSTAYRIARKLVPDNKTMIEILISESKDEETLKDDIKTFTTLLTPLLDEIHSILGTYGLDRLKAT